MWSNLHRRRFLLRQTGPASSAMSARPGWSMRRHSIRITVVDLASSTTCHCQYARSRRATRQPTERHRKRSRPYTTRRQRRIQAAIFSRRKNSRARSASPSRKARPRSCSAAPAAVRCGTAEKHARSRTGKLDTSVRLHRRLRFGSTAGTNASSSSRSSAESAESTALGDTAATRRPASARTREAPRQHTK